MTSGTPSRRRRLLSLLLLGWPLTTPAAELDALLARVARPAPATAAYIELRYSALLTEPVVTRGELEYRAAGELGKRIDEPFREQVTIRGDQVRIERPGEPLRRFSLARAPELRGLLASFGALLGGDRAALERHFVARLEETPAGWRLELTPRESRARGRVERVVVHGRGHEPRCVEVEESGGSASFMLLAAAADEPLPARPARELAAARCRAPALATAPTSTPVPSR